LTDEGKDTTLNVNTLVGLDVVVSVVSLAVSSLSI